MQNYYPYSFKTYFMMIELREDNLHTLIEQNKNVIVQYAAGWCGNCRIMKPKFKKLAAEHPDILFVIADAEKYPESRKLATVDNLPTFASFEDGSFKSQTQTNKFDVLKELVENAVS